MACPLQSGRWRSFTLRAHRGTIDVEGGLHNIVQPGETMDSAYRECVTDLTVVLLLLRKIVIVGTATSESVLVSYRVDVLASGQCESVPTGKTRGGGCVLARNGCNRQVLPSH